MVRTHKLGGILRRGMSSSSAFRHLQCTVINISYSMTHHTCAHTHTRLPQKHNFHEATLLIHMTQSDISNSILSYSVLFYFIKKKKKKPDSLNLFHDSLTGHDKHQPSVGNLDVYVSLVPFFAISSSDCSL